MTPIVNSSTDCRPTMKPPAALRWRPPAADRAGVVAYVSSDGTWRVVSVVIDRTGRAPRTVLRVTHHGFLIADCVTVQEVARHIGLDQLELVDDETQGH